MFLSCAQSNFAQLKKKDIPVLNNLHLDNQLCFPLYALSRQMTALYRPHLEALELTYPQYLVMLLLWQHEKLSVKEIGCELWLDSGTLTPLLKRMEETGLITRLRCPEDERVVKVGLTSEGKKLQKKAEKIPDILFSELAVSATELQSLKKGLCDILHRMEKKI